MTFLIWIKMNNGNTRVIIRLLFVCFLTYTFCGSYAQAIVAAEGRSEIRIEDGHCFGKVKQHAEDLAKINALENKFGRLIVEGNSLYIENLTNGNRVQTTSKFSSISNSLVKGEWIETQTKKYIWTQRTVNSIQGKKIEELWLSCTIRGKVRELHEPNVNFETGTYRCTDLELCKTTLFPNGEPLYVSFKSPVSGFLAIFMKEQGRVYRLLPYKEMPQMYESHVPIKADQEYLFFSGKHLYFSNAIYAVDEYILETIGPQTFNRLYFVFSPKPFKKPPLEDNTQNQPSSLSEDKFLDWIGRNKSGSKDFSVDYEDIILSGNEKD